MRNGNDVAALATACGDALRASDADRPEHLLADADQRLPEGGGDHLQDRLTNLQADLAMLRELDAIDLFRWTPIRSKFPTEQMVADRIRSAFAQFGVRVGTTQPQEMASRVYGSVIASRLVVALDRWLAGEKRAEVREVLRILDPDPYRDRVRDADLAGNRDEVARLARQPAVLAQPVGFLLFQGEHRHVPAARGRELLAAARQQRPGELAVLMALGWTYPLNRRNSADERVRWFQAAVEVAPANPSAHHNLGIALRDRGDLVEAAAEFRAALAIDRTLAHSHNSLGNVLADLGDLDGAARFPGCDPVFAE